ncbi:MAG: transcription termination factor Rho [Victivallales bacterium]|nr:transcription termination factor Rho [Victivallales bacterium]
MVGELQDATPQQEYFQNKRQRRYNQQSQQNGLDGVRQNKNDKNNQRRQRRKDNYRDNNEHRNPKIGDVRDIDHYTDAERARIEEAVITNPKVIKFNELEELGLDDLNKLAETLELEGIDTRNRHDVLLDIVNKYALDPSNAVIVTGVLQIAQEGYGFLRTLNHSYTQHIDDVYVTQLFIRRLGLRTGDTIVGQVRHPRDTENFFTLMKIVTLNGDTPDSNKRITTFENLTPFFPTQRLFMERMKDKDLSTRVIDLVTPIGRGQRGLIVAGPRTGKTVIMQKIANSILENDPDVELIILLIDERPEEVTDMKRAVNAEVVSSTFDQSPERHAQVAEMVIEKAKRQVEHGHHVVIMLDSITRLARAYNTLQPHSGRILSGGVDANALQKPKRFFGAARNIEGGGSLTILATALIDTGSKMDEVIFEEFKGTGNMELHLDSKLVDRRIYPAIDIEASGTRREELIVHPDELERLWLLRRAYCSLDSVEAMTDLLKHLKKSETNAEFLCSIKIPPKETEG